MKDIELSASQFDFLTTHMSSSILLNSLKANKKFSSVYLNLSAEEMEQILTVLANLLTEIGINKNFEPNPTGYLIESIIDSINRKLYDL